MLKIFVCTELGSHWKFSPKQDSDASKRMSDLLIYEYLVAKVLKQMNQDSVEKIEKMARFLPSLSAH